MNPTKEEIEDVLHFAETTPGHNDLKILAAAYREAIETILELTTALSDVDVIAHKAINKDD